MDTLGDYLNEAVIYSLQHPSGGDYSSIFISCVNLAKGQQFFDYEWASSPILKAVRKTTFERSQQRIKTFYNKAKGTRVNVHLVHGVELDSKTRGNNLKGVVVLNEDGLPYIDNNTYSRMNCRLKDGEQLYDLSTALGRAMFIKGKERLRHVPDCITASISAIEQQIKESTEVPRYSRQYDEWNDCFQNQDKIDSFDERKAAFKRIHPGIDEFIKTEVAPHVGVDYSNSLDRSTLRALAPRESLKLPKIFSTWPMAKPKDTLFSLRPISTTEIKPYIPYKF